MQRLKMRKRPACRVSKKRCTCMCIVCTPLVCMCVCLRARVYVCLIQ